jgi:hypothetical protein
METEDIFSVIDNNGLIIKQSNSFPNGIAGSIKDILDKSKILFPEEETISINLVYDNKTAAIKNEKGNTFCVIINT